MLKIKIKDAFISIKNGANIKQDKSSGGIPITRIETIVDNKIDIERLGFANINDNSFQDYYLKDGDILMSHINSVSHLGKVALFEDLNVEIIHGMNLLCLKSNKSKIFPKYAYYYFRSPIFINSLKKITKKSVNQASFNISNLQKLTLTIPENLADQIRIAEVLTKVETLIEQRKESIDLLNDFLRSTFLDMFGDPVKNEKKWEMVKLSQLGSLDRGVSKNRPRNAPELLGGIYPLIQTGEVSNSGLFIKKYKNTYSELGLKQSKLWDEGTMLITIAANIAQTSILTFKACFPDSIVGFNSNKKESNVIYVHFLFSFFQKILEYNAPSSAQKNINLGILRELKVPKPSIKLQNKFASIVEKAENVKEKYVDSLKELENLFGALSQKAFKGELDLSKLDVSTQIREIEKKVEAESGLDISLETKLTKSMQQFIKQTAEIQKRVTLADKMIPKSLFKQIESINKSIEPFQNLNKIPEQLALAMKSFDGIKSITSTLNEEKKSTWSSMRDLGELGGLEFDETEGLALIEIVFSKRKEGFTFEDFENLLRKEKFKYSYKQIQQFIFKLIAEKKLTQHFLSNKKENRLLQLKEDNNEIFFGDERIWLKYNN